MSKKEQRKSHLTIAEKGWIVQHAEKNPSLSGRRLAVDFTVKFDRLIYRGTINPILKQKKEIRQIYETAKDLNKNSKWDYKRSFYTQTRGLIKGHL